MKIEDYNKVTDRLELKKDCFKEVMEMMEKDKNKKRGFAKRGIVPVAVAAVLACGTMTAVFAGEIKGIFSKNKNFEMSIETVEESEASAVPILKAVPKKWDDKVMNKLFADGKTVVDSDEYPSDLNPDIIRKWWDYDDDTLLCYEDGYLYWKRRSDYDYGYIGSVIEYGHNAGEILFPNEEIVGFDKELAVSQADEIMSELDIPIHSKEVIALDKENLIKADNARNENGERIDKHEDVLPEWTEEQEAYLIIYHESCGSYSDIPISNAFMEFSDFGAQESRISVIVSKNGLEYIAAFMVYDVFESGKENAVICDAQAAADAINEQVTKSNGSYYPTSVSNCRLTYIPVANEFGKEYELHPFWEFYSTKDVDGMFYGDDLEPHHMNFYSTIFVDAETIKVEHQSSNDFGF